MIASLIDSQLEWEGRDELVAHVAACRACSQELESAQWQRAALRSLAAAPVPARLAGRLRVIASHEQARQLTRLTWRARMKTMCERMALQFENMMKPAALPVAGGLISAMLMFGVLIPSVSYARIETIEPPTPVFTDPSGLVVGEGEFPKLQPANQPAASGKIVVLLWIDDRGKVCDYRVTRGAMTPEVQNFILFSLFNPATSFGRPTWGEVQAVFGADNASDRRS